MDRLGSDNFSTFQMKGHVLHRARAHLTGLITFSSPEAPILLVSDGDRDLWLDPTPEVRDSRTYRHCARAQSQV